MTSIRRGSDEKAELARRDDLDPVPRQQCRRHPLSRDEAAAEAAIVDLTRPARRAARLQQRRFDAETAYRLQGDLRPGDKNCSDVVSVTRDDTGLPIQDGVAVAADDLGRLAGSGKPASDFGAHGHDLPAGAQFDQARLGAARTVVGCADAQQTGTDQVDF